MTSGAGLREFRVFGPPGTGKSTYVTKQIAKAIESEGADRVFVTSFTRAAAVELLKKAADDGLPVNRNQVGTLHAHCFRVLGRPELAEGHVEDWNQEHPQYALGSKKTDVDEPFGEGAQEGAASAAPSIGRGDELFGKAQIFRARMTPRQWWPSTIRDFDDRWREWKASSGFMDFTDLIETALRDVETAPGRPSIGFVDEAQDLNPLQFALVRKWGAHMETMVVVGDDDQCIYGWTGATPDVFLSQDPPPAHMQVLSASWRVPRAVHAAAQSVVLGIHDRQAKDYRARDADGLVRRSQASWKNPRPLCDDIEAQLSAGRDCMVLASCSYMLGGVLAELRDRGIPFWNRYRRTRGDWNPLRRGGEKVHTALDRFMAFLSNDPEALPNPPAEWTWESVALWSEPLQAKGILKTGAKAALKDKSREGRAEMWELVDFFEPEALERAYAHDLDWLESSLLAAKRNAFTLPIAIARTRGKKAVLEEPKVCVGTIHSVKGGEAQVVYLMPDLSNRGYEQWAAKGTEGKDATLRQFYVGMTRAREELVLCAPATRMAFQFRAGAA